MTTSAPLAAPRPVLADLVPGARVRDAALVVGGAALVGLLAQVAVPLPGTPVPLTGQTFGVLLVGTALGWQRGALALAFYALAGLAGVPWFAEGASGYPAATFGYVVGFLLAAALVGALARRGVDRSPLRTFAAMALGTLVIYAVGVPWLAVGAGLPLGSALWNGAGVFLLGDALKAALAAGLLPATWKLLGER